MGGLPTSSKQADLSLNIRGKRKLDLIKSEMA